MPYIQPDIVERAKQMDLLTYLRNYEPYELVHVSGNVYSTKSHDSLKISNGMWMWWSRGIGGKSALDYLIKVRDVSFLDAVRLIMGQAAAMPSVSSYQEKNYGEEQRKELDLPERNKDSNRVIRYLMGRGISKELILDCIEHGEIYESADYHNVVFVGFDKYRQPKYAAYRSCNERRIMGDVPGSDKSYSFRFENDNSTEVHAFESAIDLLSYATLLRLSPEEFRQCNYVSLAGIYVPKKDAEQMKMPKALKSFIHNGNQITTLYLHLDNDEAGRLATQMIIKQYEKTITVIDEPAPSDKDMNAYLMRLMSNIERERKKEYER